MRIFVRFFHTKYINKRDWRRTKSQHPEKPIATPRAWRRECQNFSYDLNEWPLNFTRLHAWWWWVLAWLEPLLILHFATPSPRETKLFTTWMSKFLIRSWRRTESQHTKLKSLKFYFGALWSLAGRGSCAASLSRQIFSFNFLFSWACGSALYNASARCTWIKPCAGALAAWLTNWRAISPPPK